MPTVVFDIDGVLADFTLAFTSLAAQRYLYPVSSCGAQKDWDYKGLSQAELSHLWGQIHSSPIFWARVPTLLTEGDHVMVTRLVAEKVKFTYVTTRSSNNPASLLFQTTTALKEYGMPDGEVIVSTNKVLAVKKFSNILGIIEDSNMNIAAYDGAGLPVYRRVWPYNDSRDARGIPVGSVAEFCDRMLMKLKRLPL